jgi:hypothetical protein
MLIVPRNWLLACRGNVLKFYDRRLTLISPQVDIYRIRAR